MLVHWITSGIHGATLKDYTSSLASNRYRVIAPVRSLCEAGHDVKVIDAQTWDPSRSASADVVALGKLHPPEGAADFETLSRHVLDGSKACAALGVTVVADFNDDHFAHPVMGHHWRQSAAHADLCVASTKTMDDVLAAHTKSPRVVIGDPVSSPRADPRVVRSNFGRKRILERWLSSGRRSRLQLVWYGNMVNWGPMLQWLVELAPVAKEVPWLCWVVTKSGDKLHAQIKTFNQRYGPDAMVQWAEWEEQAHWEVVHDADIVMLPSDVGSSFHRAKSTNRLADALHAGRYVIASPLPAYQPFANWVSLTDDPCACVMEYLQNPEAAKTKIEAGQRYVETTYGADVIGRLWAEALATARRADKPRAPETIIEQPRAAEIIPTAVTSEPAPKLIRLNLGCGDKVLVGYVNVDVVESRGGKRPDVLCDLHRLSVFEDGVADEVMAIHVVEHFWRWEIEDVLKEWVRVLKPGGKMILECPNLQAACEEFLKDPDRFSSQGREGQRTMWVFYGDPAWKDPYMIHRWGYTPKSLATLMQSVGLVGVEQQAAQFKLREPRDMRLIGYKPV